MFHSSVMAAGVVIPCLVVLAARFAQSAGGSRSRPADLAIVARFEAGFSGWQSWESTISPRGRVERKIGWVDRAWWVPEDAREEIRKHSSAGPIEEGTDLDEQDMIDLWARIEEARFFELEGSYLYDVTDCHWMILEVTANGKAHRVVLYALALVKDRDAVDRFSKVWAEFLRKVPSPNPEDTPEHYRDAGRNLVEILPEPRKLNGWTEGACTATALGLFCGFLCAGLSLLAGLSWLLGMLRLNDLILPIFGAGLLANVVVSFLLGGKVARRLFPAGGR